MAIKTVEKIIDGEVYKINTLNTSNSVKFLARFTKLFGTSIPVMFSGGDSVPNDVETLEALKIVEHNQRINILIAAGSGSEDDLKKLSPEQELFLAKKAENDAKVLSENITKAVRNLVESMDKEDVGSFVKELYLASSVARGTSTQLLDYENGISDVGELIQIIIFIIQTNFGSVFRLGGIAV